ncbi:peptidylprolyl isomerase [Cognatishimia sp. D5M38]|uniref:Parvulin-like PPIase n=1 Tax=Cognatishimia coralii TaxID=3083254 RepID=A0ABU8QC99_9RHOB
MTHKIFAAFLSLTLGVMGTLASAQGLFSPAIKVNDGAVTYYELDQRIKFMQFINRLGDLETLARKDLVEDRLKAQAAAELGISISAEQLAAGLEEFAGRANLKADEVIALMAEAQIDRQTFEDFVRNGLLWREVVQLRFRGRVQISDEEIDAALGSGGQAGLQVLLSEIVIPINAQNQAQVQDLASRISNLTTESAFADAARRFSAAGTRTNGGRMQWLPINRLPPALQPVVVEMRPGEISDPIPLGNAIAVFMMRGIDELPSPTPRLAAIEYGILRIPGGRSDAALAQAQDIRNRVDTCDDLYAINKGGPDEALTITAEQPSAIPRSISLELAKLDRHEVSTALTSPDGSQLYFLMLCGRTAALNEDLSREDVLNALRNRRLNSYAEGYLDQLRSEAVIVEQ